MHFRAFRRALAPACAALLVACNAPQQPSAPSGEAGAQEDAKALAGRIAGKEVAVGEVDRWIMDKLFDNATSNRNANRLFEIRNRALKQMASEQALDAEAVALKLDKEQVMRQEVEKRAAVDEQEVKDFYETNKQRYGQRTFEQIQAAIRRQLEQQKRQKAMEAYLDELRAKVGFESALEPPRFKIAGDGKSRGPADAPIALVEFSDYECPYCKTAEPIVDEVLVRYPTQVRFAYRHFPLDQIHKQARTASIAAECAGEQGKFWEYHALLFEKAPKLAEADLKTYADQFGLDRAAFDACLAQQRTMGTIDSDIDAGDKAGVSGTPAFFVNGLPLTGARSLAQFAEVIDKELTRLGLPAPPPLPAAAEAPSAPAAAVPPGPAAAAAVPAAPTAPPAPATAPAPAPAPPPAAKP
jgi:protein-disulfide isomerase